MEISLGSEPGAPGSQWWLQRIGLAIAVDSITSSSALGSNISLQQALVEPSCINLGTSLPMAVFQTTPWRLISGSLGVMCLLLIATLGILLENSFTKQSIQPTFSPGPTTEPQKGSGCCSCPEKWIGYRCNCYFFSNEVKTWTESRDFCASQNSHLLHLESKDEFSFSNFGHFYWLGLSYNETRGTWLWENGSTLSQDLFSFFQTLNPQNCILYKPSMKYVLHEDCKKNNRFICKQRPI
ncbi:natural killer cells antigen CD94-like [Orycteropus afer afer]|uniref:Natural killer cells antigen CD94 n=1 Tax=Orycteropus afer afer TaxID=1230840 RepID=A0A8B6ZJZ7_ORYAF|nr:natural killer cells antigen CD94-like [Orycteropus afer afer]